MIPTTEEEQRSATTLIDASDVDLSVMGTMNNGGGAPGGDDAREAFAGTEDGEMPDNMPQGGRRTGKRVRCRIWARAEHRAIWCRCLVVERRAVRTRRVKANQKKIKRRKMQKLQKRK